MSGPIYIHEALYVLNKNAAEINQNSEELGYHSSPSQNATALGAQQQPVGRPTDLYKPIKFQGNPQCVEPGVMKKTAERAYRRAKYKINRSKKS